MSALSKIQWTDRTWNPVTGCTKVSPGCKNCYAEANADRFWATQYGLGVYDVPGVGEITRSRRFTDVRCHQERLAEPLRWRKPARVFVNSMSDLFHEDVPFEFIKRVWDVCANLPQHTFQILTKRPSRARTFAQWMAGLDDISIADWPRNVHLGVSVENQATADERIPILLQTPATVRFLSVEPILERVCFRWAKWDDWSDGKGERRKLVDAYDGLRMLDWVIVGGESGPHARPCNVEWIRDVVEQCRRASVPVFVKQLGAFPIMSADIWRALSPTPLLNAARHYDVPTDADYVPLKLGNRKGDEPSEWPEDLRVREFPRPLEG